MLPRFQSVIFVHGCFWHRHRDCKYAYEPKSRVEFWQHKFDENMKRDRVANRALRKNGWHVLIIWECQISDDSALKRRLTRFLRKREV